MNKLYSVITKSLLFSILLIGAGSAAMAQTLSNAVIPITTSKLWSVTEPGITTCNVCTINISNGATLTIDRAVTFGSNNPSIGGSIINVTGNGKLVIGTGTPLNVSLSNSQIVVGSASVSTTNINPDASSIHMSANGTLTLLDNVSTIRLANSNNTITGDAGTGGTAISNGTAGQILYSFNSTSASFYSANWAYNSNSIFTRGLGHGAGTNSPYTGPPSIVTGPALSGVGSTVIPGLGLVTLASFSGSPVILPITLVNFAASLNSNGSVGLTWATDEEENSAYFNIQRSANGGAWTNIGKVAAQGNSSVTTDYSFTDASPVSGTDDYRLQSTDLNGSYTFSSVKVIRTAGQSAGFSIFPNPASSQVNVSLASTVSNATIRLVDLSGKTLVEQKVTNAANTIVTIPVQGFVNGTYVLVVKSSDGSQYTGKVLIAH
jgi:hypothetical protein